MAYMPSSGRWFFVVASGWPFYAFHGGGVMYPPAGAISDARAPAALTLPAWVPTRQNHAPSIPVAPLWRGLLLNLAFWSLATLAAIRMVRYVRARRLSRASCCQTCGYQLAHSQAGCPECGRGRRA